MARDTSRDCTIQGALELMTLHLSAKWQVVFMTAEGLDYCREPYGRCSFDQMITKATNDMESAIAAGNAPKGLTFRVECW